MNASVNLAQAVNLSKATFLVVAGKPLLRDVAQSVLLGAGAQSIKHANTVEKAIELLNRHGQEIACVMCDWDMAPVGGLELLRMIRCQDLRKTAARTPVVILTTRADAGAVQTAMAMDVNGFAVAPLSLEKLVKTVMHALTRPWQLQTPDHYRAVPKIEISTEPVPQPISTRSAPSKGISAAASPRTQQAKAVAAKLPPKDELGNVRLCTLTNVEPGQILARDLHARDGSLMLSTGVVLNATLIDRLTKVAAGHADSYHLWVGERQNPSA